MRKKAISRVVAFAVCNVALTTFSVASNSNEAMLVESNFNADVIAKNHLLRLGYDKTTLSEQLEKNYSTKSVANEYTPSADIIKKEISSVSILHIDLDSYYGERKTLDAYVNEAQSQYKLLVLENVTSDDLQTIPSLPALVAGNVVLIKPLVSGGTEIISYESSSADEPLFGAESASVPLDKAGFVDQEIENDIEKSPTLSNLSAAAGSKKSQNMLSTINTDVVNLLSLDSRAQQLHNKAQARMGTTGGSYGYNCPWKGQQNRLCSWGKITKKKFEPYDLHVSHGASYAMYRTRKETKVFISPYGNANPSFYIDENKKKAFILDEVAIKINPTLTAGLSLERRTPANENNNSALLSSSGVEFQVGADGSGPTGSFSYSDNRGVRTNIKDWKSETHTHDGLTAHWLFKLSRFPRISDWIDIYGAGFLCRLHLVPSISAKGIQYSSEGYWGSNNPRQGGYFTAIISTRVQKARMTLKHKVFTCEAKKEWWSYDAQESNIALNLGWLKKY